MSSVLGKLLADKPYSQLRQLADAAGADAASLDFARDERGGSGVGDNTEGNEMGADDSLFGRITSMAGLQAGWQRVLARSPMPGGDGMSVASYAAGADGRLALLSHNLRSGRYRPGPLRRFSIPKKHGDGTRQLGLLCVADRVVQSSALLCLTPLFEAEFESGSFGYRPGRSVKAAGERITSLYRQGFRWVVEADIIAYFDNVPHGPLQDDLAALLPDRRLQALMAQWLDMAGTGDRGLVQGAPISPLLANLYLDRLDEAVAARGAHIVRFADDFVILTKSREQAERQLHAITTLLRERGLELHLGKTRISDFDQGFAFLGRRFLKSFVLDDGDGLDADEWDEALLAAIPPDVGAIGADAIEGAIAAKERGEAIGGDDEPTISRQFRNHDMGAAKELPSRPVPVEDAMQLRKLSPRQRCLHLYGKGRKLDCRDYAFTVEENGAEIWLGGADRIDRIDIGPHADFSAAALRFALAKGTDVFFVDGHGMTQGRLNDAPGGRAALHLAQAAHIVDEGARLGLAREFVAGKIYNQRKVVQRWRYNAEKSLRAEAGNAARHQAIVAGIKTRLEQMRRLIEKAKRAEDMGALLGFEGAAAKIFLQIFRLALRGWSFGARKRRPAPDAVNAVLNWTAHLLAREVEVCLRRHGLHVGFGHLHRSEDGRASLVFDMVEEFRAPLVEAVTLVLFNTGELRADHFFEPPEKPGSVWIAPEGIKQVITRFEAMIAEERLAYGR
ncbi:MAG: hypothetical protein RLY97_2280, partial [Pseudomonadota bacterium]